MYTIMLMCCTRRRTSIHILLYTTVFLYSVDQSAVCFMQSPIKWLKEEGTLTDHGGWGSNCGRAVQVEHIRLTLGLKALGFQHVESTSPFKLLLSDVNLHPYISACARLPPVRAIWSVSSG